MAINMILCPRQKFFSTFFPHFAASTALLGGVGALARCGVFAQNAEAIAEAIPDMGRSAKMEEKELQGATKTLVLKCTQFFFNSRAKNCFVCTLFAELSYYLFEECTCVPNEEVSVRPTQCNLLL